MPSRVRVRVGTPLLAIALAACGHDPVGPAIGPWAQVAAGDQFSCALDTNGEAWCWGAAIFGQLGNDGTTPSSMPSKVAGGRVFRSLAVGSDHACAIEPDGSLWCWGLNDFAELGAPTMSCNATFRFVTCARVPVLVTAAPAFDSVVVAGYASCGLTPAGDAHCWGWSDHGQIGSTAVGSVVQQPALVSGGRRFVALTLDIYHACGVTAAGTLFCWGSNDHGQLAADSTATPRCGVGAGFLCATSPVASAAGVAATSVSAGSTHTCAATAAGEAWCWGSNQYGVLGDPAATGGAVPVRVAGTVAFATLSAGMNHTCALTTDGAAWCWGVNTEGQLGVASVSEACPAFGSAQPCATSPIAVEGAHVFAAISAGSSHTCALDSDGEIWCWGRGIAGQLGTGAFASSSVPARVAHP